MNFIIFVIGFIFCGFSLFAILAKNPIHSILSLVIVFFSASIFSLILGAEFLALLFLIVYVGAIAVLFLFVVMLLNIRIIEISTGLIKYWWLGFLMSSFFLFTIYKIFIEIVFFEFSSNETLVYFEVIWSLYESNSIGLMGECLFIFFPGLILAATFLLLVAVVCPVILTFLSFSLDKITKKKNEELTGSLVMQRRQNIFAQTYYRQN